MIDTWFILHIFVVIYCVFCRVCSISASYTCTASLILTSTNMMFQTYVALFVSISQISTVNLVAGSQDSQPSAEDLLANREQSKVTIDSQLINANDAIDNISEQQSAVVSHSQQLSQDLSMYQSKIDNLENEKQNTQLEMRSLMNDENELQQTCKDLNDLNDEIDFISKKGMSPMKGKHLISLFNKIKKHIGQQTSMHLTTQGKY